MMGVRKKGNFEIAPFMLSAILFIIASFIVYAFFGVQFSQVTSHVVIPTLQKTMLADRIKIFESCIKENNVLTKELIEKKAGVCMEKTKLTHAKITNVESGSEVAYGNKGSGQYSYKIFTQISSGKDIDSGIIYAEA